MRYVLMILALVTGLSFVGPAFADAPTNSTKVTVDLQDLGTNERSAVLDAVKNEQPKITNVTPDEVKKWSAIGKGIGDAFAATAKALNVGINDFIKTPAGVMVMWGLAVYLWGGTLWGVFAGSLIWLILGSLIYRSFRKFHMPYVLKNADGSEKLDEYPWSDGGWKITSGIIHGGAFIIISAICLSHIL